MNKIHSTAIVSTKAELGNNIEIGPYAIIEDDVIIGNDCKIGPHAVLYNGTRLGERVKIFQSSSVANIPQDLKFEDEPSLFEVGDDTIIREFSTLHRGTKESGFSKIGKNCLLMAYAHVAHDCIVGDNCILANVVQLGGHAVIEDWVILGGGVLVHQFSKVGQHSMVGGGFRVIADVPPYVLAAGEPLYYNGLNTIGLRRRGFSNEQISSIKDAYNILYSKEHNYSRAKEIIASKFENNDLIKNILKFLESTTRSIIKG